MPAAWPRHGRQGPPAVHPPPRNPSRHRPINPHLAPLCAAPLWGFFPQIRCSHHQVDGGRSWRKEGGAGGGEEAGGPLWSMAYYDVLELLFRRMRRRRQKEKGRGRRSRSSSSQGRRRTKARSRRCATSASAASSRAVPRRALFCILCSASALLPRPVTTSSPLCPGAQGEPQPPRTCCGPGLRAEAEPSLVSSMSSVLILDCCPAPRRRADPPSPESRPSSRASRFAGAAAYRNVRAPCFASC
jgi:hypothetical protein